MCGREKKFIENYGGKTVGKRKLGRLGHRWKNIKMNLQHWMGLRGL
jgi:hypothetical protein